jgi:hypothetical protein
VSRPSRVLHLPGEHAYVQAITPATVTAVELGPAGVRHPAFAPEWIRENAFRFDAVHLHFGFEHLSAVELAIWVAELDRAGIPLVFTVHDLRNPHQDTPAHHDRHLDLLVPAASALLTLTPSAARAIAARWGRHATVVPHPPVVGDAVRPARTTGRVVGIHLKDLRRNVVEPGRVVAAAARGAEAAGGRLRVDLHPGVVDRPEVAPVHRLAAAGALDLRVHPRFGDDELWEYLAGLAVSVLPYRFGTHSGWLEACRDVGTRVVAPSCGYYPDQWDEVVTYPHDEVAGLDEQGLEYAVSRALRRPALAVPAAEVRLARRDRVRAAHAAVYAGLPVRRPVAA